MDFNLILKSLQNDIIFMLELLGMLLSFSYVLVVVIGKNLKTTLAPSKILGLKYVRNFSSSRFFKLGVLRINQKFISKYIDRVFTGQFEKFSKENSLSLIRPSAKKLRHLRLIENKFSSSSIYKGIKAKPNYILSEFHFMNRNLRVGSSIPAKRSA